MAIKTIDVPGIGTVRLQKRRGTRSVRLSVDQKGLVRVSLPSWVPFAAGKDFVLKNQPWVEKQLARRPISPLLKNGDRIGKAHTLVIDTGAVLKTRVTTTEIRVSLPPSETSETAQAKILSACERALRHEAEQLLPQRLQSLANTYSFHYRSVHIKKLKTRWGSCSSTQEITLNYFLMQLPWDLIDYVLIHELTHTEHMHHQNDFWDALSVILPDYKTRRQALKQFQPTVIRTTL